MTRVASFVALLAILVAISVIFYWVMVDFLLPLFIAAFLVVVFRPLNDRILKALNGRRHFSAVLTTAAVLLIVLLPIIAVGSLALLESVQLVNEIRVASTDNPLRRLRRAFGVEHPAIQEIKAIDKSYVESLTLVNGRNNEVEIQAELRNLDRLVLSLEDALPEQSIKDPLNDLHEDLLVLQDETDPSELKERISDSRTAFVNWKMRELGGAPWAYITELVNPDEQEWREITSSLFSRGQSLLVQVTRTTSSTVVRVLIGGIITIVALFFFLSDGPAMIKSVMHLSPLDDRYEKELLDEFVQVSRAVLLATMLSACAQALLAGIGYYFAGVESVVLLMVMTGILAMIPLVGTFGVWGPVCAWLYFVEGRLVAAALLALYGVSIVSTVDNFIKPAVLHGQSRLHPLLALLSVLGGVKALGPIGILVGPMVVVFLQTLLNILHRELLHFEKVGNAAFATGAGAVAAEEFDEEEAEEDETPEESDAAEAGEDSADA